MAEMTALDTATHRYIRENPDLVDMVFNGTPGANLMKRVIREDFTGGRLIGENFNTMEFLR